MFSLEKKVAIVTGAAAGIGYAIAKQLRDAGAKVAMIGRRETIFDKALEIGEGVFAYQLDITEIGKLEPLVNQVKDDLGSVDILVNNAGICILESLDRVTENSWHTTMLVNLTAPFFLAKYCANIMQACHFGRIINISSQAAVVAIEEHSVYCTSKAGMLAFTRSIAAEMGQFGITCNAISPTVVETQLGKRYWYGERAVQMKRKIPSRRFASTEEIASAVVYLSSHEAGMINGENLIIDGGYSII
jgi:2-deoxy-D-gluconate 3-dehydrogenase